MRFLSRLLRPPALACAAPSNPHAGPEPARLAALPDGTNPLHRLLDDLGLPWREPRAVVETRCGIEVDPFHRRDAVFLRDAVRPPGFLEPWRVDVSERYAPDLPVVRFGGMAWSEDDATGNLRRHAAFFAERLGPAPIGREWNTLVCGWRSGAASLRLTAWPPAWQSPELRNDAHQREPRLRTAVHVTLLTGFRLPLSSHEERWMAEFQSIAEVAPLGPLYGADVTDTAPSDVEVEYARDPGMYLPAVRRRVGRSPDAEALILCTHQLFVVAREDVLGFEVIRLLPAKGGGGSTLMVRCRTSCPGVAFKTLRVTDHSDPDGAIALGNELAAVFDRPCEVGPYFDDV